METTTGIHDESFHNLGNCSGTYSSAFGIHALTGKESVYIHKPEGDSGTYGSAIGIYALSFENKGSNNQLPPRKSTKQKKLGKKRPREENYTQ